MNPQVLFVITGDPRTSPRPAEAIRIAAGVGVWGKIDITVYLRGPAVLALAEYVDDWVDADHFSRYLPLIAESGRPVYVERDTPELAALGASPIPFQAINDDDLARLSVQSNYLVRF